MSRSTNHSWLHRFAVLTAAATLALIGIGGLVTSHGAGMAVPDWPTSYGYNMFALPIRFWQGGIFYEHTHRLWATFVGVLIVALTRWAGGRPSRGPLILIGLAEIIAGLILLWIKPELKGVGHFLAGIGGVVLLAGAVWLRNEPAARPLPQLSWLAFCLVQFQGLLGGLRVVLFKDQLGVFHATLAQLFFVLLCVIALFTSGWWQRVSGAAAAIPPRPDRETKNLHWLFIGTTLLILLQLILGATMRHQHAGLAIPDFPLAYGKLWPATDAESVLRYNQQRMETSGINSITAFQIELQMAHRIVAVLILAAVAFCAWRVRNWRLRFRAADGANDSARGGMELRMVSRLSLIWLCLILAQVALGAATVLTGKAADLATLHVLAGALSLAMGGLLCIVSHRCPVSERREPIMSGATAGERAGNSFTADPAATH